MTDDLAGRVAVVTGAGSGIGRAAARRLAQDGARVVLVGRDPARLAAVDAELTDMGAEVLAVPGDLAVAGTAASIVVAATDRFGPPDLLLSNAGIYVAGQFAEIDIEDMQTLLSTNVFGAFAMVRAVLPQMIDRGRGDVVMTSSVSGTQDIHWEPIYSASKHAVDSFVHTVRRQLAGTGVRLGGIAPGVVLNELWGYAQEDDGPRAEQMAAQAGIRSEDVVDAIMFMVGRPRHVTIRDLVILPSGQPI